MFTCWWNGHDWGPMWHRVEDWHVEVYDEMDYERMSDPIEGKGGDPNMNYTRTYRERRCCRCDKLESIEL